MKQQAVKPNLINVHRLFMLTMLLFSSMALWSVFIPTAQAAVGFKAATSASDTIVTGGGTIMHIGAGNVASRDDSCGSITASPFTGTGAAIGDLLIASVNSRNDDTTLSDPTSGANPWNLLYTSIFPGENLKVILYYRFADGTAADNLTINQTNNCESLAAQISRFSNVNSTNPFRTMPPLSNTGGAGGCGTNTRCQNSDNIDTGTQAGVMTNDMLVVASFVRDNSYLCQDTDWTESFESRLDLDRDLALGMHFKLAPSTGAYSISGWDIDTGAFNCSNPDDDDNYGIIFALRPAPSGSGEPQLTINVPTGTVAGDVMIASVTTTPDTPPTTVPAGWTLVRQLSHSDNSSVLITYYKLATTTEPLNYTWTFSSAGFGGAVGGIASFTGVDNSMPIDTEAGVEMPSGTDHTAPDVSAVLPDSMLVTIHEYSSSWGWTPPAGMMEAVDIFSESSNGPDGISIEMNYQALPAAGPTGSRTATAGGDADSGITQSIVLRPRPMACYSDDFNRTNGSPGPDYIVSSNSGSFGTPKIVNNRLRLTDNTGNVATMANLQHIFPGAGNRIEVEFEHYAYGHTGSAGADGIAFILSDYGIPPAPGGYGGSLGYANTTNGPGYPGFAGGWIGIGIDEYGNFSNPNEGRNGGPGFRVDAIAIRGSGSGTTGYQYHAGTNTLTPEVDNNNVPPLTTPHKYRIIVDHSNSTNAMTSLERDTGSGYVTLVAPYDAKAKAGQAAVPTDWVLSYTGSTGGANNIHEIDNLQICATYITSLVGTDHYNIDHSGSGVTCNSELITITAHDASHNPVDASSNTITLSTSTGRGTWSRVVTGTGTLVDATAGDGAATYTFPGGESSVVLALNYTNPISTDPAIPDTFSINVTDGISTEQSGSATMANDDSDMSFYTAGFIYNNETDGNQTIPTQISGKNSNASPGVKLITLQAVRADDDNPAICLPVFMDTTKSIDLGAECRNPVACAGGVMSINGTGISTNNDDGGSTTTAYTNFPNLAFDANGKANLVLNYNDAGLMQLHARHNILLDDGSGTPSGDYMYGGSNDFVVRPFGLAFTDVRNHGADTTYGTADDVLNPGGTASGGAGFIAAQDVFRVTLQGYQYDPADDLLDNLTGMAGPDGIPDVGKDITDNGSTPNFAWNTALSPFATIGFTSAGSTVGSLGGTTIVPSGSYTSGTIIGEADSAGDLTYSEAGGVTLQALATDYISAGVNVFGYSPPVGRFFPHHFSLESSLVTAANGSFTYMGQDALEIDFTLAARGASGALLSNYDANLGYADTAAILIAAENNNDGMPLDNRLNDPAGSWAGGSYIYSSTTETFARAAGEDGPYQALQLSIKVDSLTNPEADNRDIETLDQKTDQNNDCVTDTNCTSRAIGNLTDVRFGRLRVQNAFGSELLGLPIPVIAEYYVSDGADGGFVTNPDDSSTTYDALAGAADAQPVSLSNYLGNLGPGETTANGNGMFMSGMADPANPIILSNPGAGNDGSVTVNLAVPAWLQFDWDGDGNHDNDPTGTATFGIFHGNDATIYRRELY